MVKGNREYVTTKTNKELRRIHNLFTNITGLAIKRIATISTWQQDSIRDLSTNTMIKFTSLCTTTQIPVNNKTEARVAKVTENYTKQKQIQLRIIK